MLSIAKRTIQTYFLMDNDNKIMPKEFIANKVTGIFFENKADYATWFGANPEFIHGQGGNSGLQDFKTSKDFNRLQQTSAAVSSYFHKTSEDF
ncbi:unnamed protein product [Rotaria sp. Silwood2]|nr:unnamed protein product [Rotaria sp. Silwood2]